MNCMNNMYINLILQFIDKSCYSSQLNQALTQCVPVHIPFMVKIVRFWELDHCIVLLLELASNGKLWDHLKLYFKSKRQEFYKSCVCHFHTPRYSIRKVIFSVGDSKPTTNHPKRQSAEEPEECLSDNYDCVVRRDSNRMSDKVTRLPLELLDLDSEDNTIVNDVYNKDWSHQKFENLIRKWTAQIIIAVSHLHSEGMICRYYHTKKFFCVTRVSKFCNSVAAIWILTIFCWTTKTTFYCHTFVRGIANIED